MLPEKYKEFFDPAGNLLVTAYAQGSSWQRQIIPLMPEFIERAARIFGRDLPHINFYFFDTRQGFEGHYRELLGCEMPDHYWHDGTGSMNLVVFCDVGRDGNPGRGAGDVIHEYGHALCNTIYGAAYLDEVPMWLNEGIADYLSLPWYEELYNQSPSILKEEIRKGQVPDYQLFQSDFYQLHLAAYPIGRLMVLHLMKDKEASLAADILRLAKSQAGDFESAIIDLAKVDPRDLYDRVIREHCAAPL